MVVADSRDFPGICLEEMWGNAENFHQATRGPSQKRKSSLGRYCYTNMRGRCPIKLRNSKMYTSLRLQLTIFPHFEYGNGRTDSSLVVHLWPRATLLQEETHQDDTLILTLYIVTHMDGFWLRIWSSTWTQRPWKNTVLLSACGNTSLFFKRSRCCRAYSWYKSCTKIQFQFPIKCLASSLHKLFC